MYQLAAARVLCLSDNIIDHSSGEMSMVESDEDEVIEIRDYNINGEYHGGQHDLLTPPTFTSKPTNHRIVILYVIGIFLAIVLLLAMIYLLRLNFRSWLPKRKHFCDFRDCFRQNNGKKGRFFQRNCNKANFTIPVVVVSDENGQCLDPECLDSEETETKPTQEVEIFP